MSEKIYEDGKWRQYTIQQYKGRDEKKKDLWTIKIRSDNYLNKGWQIWNPYYCPWQKYENAVKRLDQEAKFNHWKEVKK